MTALRVLVGCERSGVVRRAFRALGHDAWSCDIEPADDGRGHHIRGDLLAVLRDGWDVGIFHPPCTKLCNSGARWWKGQEAEQQAALEFVLELMAAPIPKWALENPPGKIGTAIRPADQYIQPYEFGHPETKRTGLWLKGLPKLVPTHDVRAQMEALPAAVRHRVHHMSPGPDRARLRSETYAGIARAMAEQWGGKVEAQLALELEPA
jgi:hypothetical protein